MAAAPEHVFPIPVLKLGELLAKQAAGNALETIDQLREFDARREIDPQVHMVAFPVELGEFNGESLANAGQNLPHRFDRNAFEDPPPILRREDQMGMKLEDAVPSGAILDCGFWHGTPIVNLTA